MNKQSIIDDTRERVYVRDSFLCQFFGCHEGSVGRLQMAHRLSKSRANREWIKRKSYEMFQIDLTESQVDLIIHHDFNLVTSCAKHNDYFNLGNRTNDRKDLLVRIYRDLIDKKLLEV